LNYFELHLGDYAEATQHLSILEDGVYGRLLRKYYATEKPLPAELDKVQRLIGARSKEERAAVGAVLADFFDLRDDGWHNKRADEEISAFKDGEPEREVKKGNEDLRLRKHRQDRAELFKRLNAAGHHAPWNTPIKELRDLVERVCGPEPATEDHEPATRPATAPATHATHLQRLPSGYASPDTSTQTPEEERERAQHSGAGKEPVRPAPPPEDPPPGDAVGPSTMAGRVCKAIRRAGFPGGNPGDIVLLRLLEQGATEAEFVEAAQAAMAATPPKPWGWVLKRVEGRRADAAAVVLAPPAPKPGELTGRLPEWKPEPPPTPEQKAAADAARKAAMERLGRAPA
jgi:uncharacterized protein YdaU (DUF1376 family)